MKMINKLIGCLLLLSLGACAQGPSNTLKKTSMSDKKNVYYSTTNKEKLVLPDSTWKQVLSPEVYQEKKVQKGLLAVHLKIARK